MNKWTCSVQVSAGVVPIITHAEFAGRDFEKVQERIATKIGNLMPHMTLTDSRPYIEDGRVRSFGAKSHILRINPLLAHAIETLEKTEDTKETERHFKPTSLEDLARFVDYYELAT